MKFNNWIVIKELPKYKDKYRRTFVLCQCKCGIQKPVALITLRNNTSKSCGCLWKPKSGSNHGMYKHGEAIKGKRTKEWRSWNAMIRRCKYPSMDDFPRYGGKGIKVCKRWLGKNGYIHFLKDIGRAPSPKHSLDRINNNGNYESNNCRWATPSEQILNSSKARFIIYKGKTLPIGQWAKKLDINRQTIQMRLDVYNWSIEKALSVKP